MGIGEMPKACEKHPGNFLECPVCAKESMGNSAEAMKDASADEMPVKNEEKSDSSKKMLDAYETYCNEDYTGLMGWMNVLSSGEWEKVKTEIEKGEAPELKEKLEDATLKYLHTAVENKIWEQSSTKDDAKRALNVISSILEITGADGGKDLEDLSLGVKIAEEMESLQRDVM